MDRLWIINKLSPEVEKLLSCGKNDRSLWVNQYWWKLLSLSENTDFEVTN